jgi:pimeloyl-ACP methyl ester carboxylesterase
VDLAAVPRAHGRNRPGPPGLRPQREAAGLRLFAPGYADYLEGFVDDAGLDRFSLVVHDIGAIVGLVLAQRVPERIDRLVIANHAPLLPGYRWHRFARISRTPVVGELSMATMTGFAFRRSLRSSNVNGLPDDFVDRAWAELDGGTKRAILRLYRSMPEAEMVREGNGLDRIRCATLVVWSTEDPYIGAEFGPAYADALGGEVETEVYENAGHWLWLDRPEVIDRVVGFVAAR